MGFRTAGWGVVAAHVAMMGKPVTFRIDSTVAEGGNGVST